MGIFFSPGNTLQHQTGYQKYVNFSLELYNCVHSPKTDLFYIVDSQKHSWEFSNYRPQSLEKNPGYTPERDHLTCAEYYRNIGQIVYHRSTCGGSSEVSVPLLADLWWNDVELQDGVYSFSRHTADETYKLVLFYEAYTSTYNQHINYDIFYIIASTIML